jgi:hypothetical protein
VVSERTCWNTGTTKKKLQKEKERERKRKKQGEVVELLE